NALACCLLRYALLGSTLRCLFLLGSLFGSALGSSFCLALGSFRLALGSSSGFLRLGSSLLGSALGSSLRLALGSLGLALGSSSSLLLGSLRLLHQSRLGGLQLLGFLGGSSLRRLQLSAQTLGLGTQGFQCSAQLGQTSAASGGDFLAFRGFGFGGICSNLFQVLVQFRLCGSDFLLCCCNSLFLGCHFLLCVYDRLRYRRLHGITLGGCLLANGFLFGSCHDRSPKL